MAKISVTPKAYCKIILHAAKYPHCSINGLLLSKKNKNDTKTSDLIIEDAIPLFHQCLHVSPMAEVALGLVDQYARENEMIIAGYYLANEIINDVSADKPAHRIADKIAENFSNAVLAVIDNREFTQNMNTNVLKISQFIDGKWKAKDKTDISYFDEDALTEAVGVLIKDEKYQQLIDFDNHFDNISLDWKNSELNVIIKEAVISQ